MVRTEVRDQLVSLGLLAADGTPPSGPHCHPRHRSGRAGRAPGRERDLEVDQKKSTAKKAAKRAPAKSGATGQTSAASTTKKAAPRSGRPPRRRPKKAGTKKRTKKAAPKKAAAKRSAPGSSGSGLGWRPARAVLDARAAPAGAGHRDPPAGRRRSSTPDGCWCRARRPTKAGAPGRAR